MIATFYPRVTCYDFVARDGILTTYHFWKQGQKEDWEANLDMINLPKNRIKESDMQPNLHLYHNMLRQIDQWLPDERVTRRRNLALLVSGLYLSASVHLSQVVRSWPLPGQLASLSNRLRRFLSRTEQTPQSYYQPVSYTHLTLPTNREV